MAIDDWTLVTAGTWHAFQLSWISELQRELNSGRLPADYYAQAEQIAGLFGPDILTLQTSTACELFLTDEGYVPVPLESTYGRAYDGVPKRWRDVLEPTR